MKVLIMAPEESHFLRPSRTFVVGDVPRFADQPKVIRSHDDSSQMDNECCPNDGAGSDNATGYSEQEEEAFEKAILPEAPEPVSSR
ncbi:MAG: hypothetical protein WAK13_02160 [Terriglobales bacterium]